MKDYTGHIFTILWVVDLLDYTTIWTGEKSQLRKLCQKQKPEERHHYCAQWGQGGPFVMSCPHETCPTAFTDIIKKSEDKSEQRAVCEAERERERERGEELVHLLETMNKWVMTTLRAFFRFECLLVVGCHHTSASLLSLFLTCDRRR